MKRIVGRLEEHHTPHGQGHEHFLARLVSESCCVGCGLTWAEHGEVELTALLEHSVRELGCQQWVKRSADNNVP